MKLYDTHSIALLRDECLVKIHHPERMTAAKTLFIPDGAERMDYELYQATVLATGPGTQRKDNGKHRPVEVKPGDRVVFYWLSGEVAVNRWFVGDDELRIMPESGMQAVIEA